MKVEQLFTLFLLNIVISAPLLAANIELYLVDKQLNVNVDNIQYPKSLLIQEMKSGLPNVLDMKVRLSGTDGFEAIDHVRYIITYDLWDENYSVTIIKHRAQQKKLIKTDAELLLCLSSVELSGLDTKQILRNNKELQLSFYAYFNPIQSDRIKKIQHWIQTSKGYDVPDKDFNQETITSAQVVGKDLKLSSINNSLSGNNMQVSSGPRFQKLFDKILADHMSQDAVAAQWKSKSLIKVFTVESLLREKR